LNPRGLSTTDLAGLPHTRLGESRPNRLRRYSIINVAFLFFAQSAERLSGLSVYVSTILFYLQP
jgi:hypothetical protein